MNDNEKGSNARAEQVRHGAAEGGLAESPRPTHCVREGVKASEQIVDWSFCCLGSIAAKGARNQCDLDEAIDR